MSKLRRSTPSPTPTIGSKKRLGRKRKLGECNNPDSLASLLVEDRSFADNHRLATDPNFLENSCTAREQNVNTTRTAHADALKVHEPRCIG
jgi:hypothetical protein